ncbi:MAG: HAD family phosphatase [Bacteroidetes bacterium]|nr:HAD family phosphatase [Bacteroidota bacterium]MBS1972880.1 HAD family phosphatase [Bacteroidota bacterium]
MSKVNTIVFDLGGVLIDWNPDYVFSKVFPNTEEMKWFYENICTPAWNEEQDAGKSLQQATEELIEKFPEHKKHIQMYYGRWEEMLGGPIPGTVEILRRLKHSTNHKLYALTNWSAETFPVALDRYEFLHWFNGRLVSGEEKTRKPFKEIYELLIRRFNIDAHRAIYIDDNVRNLSPAKELGFHTIHFQSTEQFRNDLIKIIGEI